MSFVNNKKPARNDRSAPVSRCGISSLSELVLQLGLQGVIGGRICCGELLEWTKVEHRLGPVRHLERLARKTYERPANQQRLAIDATEVLSAPVLVQQIEEVEHVKLED